ncbi:hypothetical protein [Candidatus Poriferisodalis sp.]|uniref:hypothetical protein n=1 Tax=Candidatus Poriferisodalis sp. TaxID=3101277 RepID=UPI003B51C2DA
MSEEDRSRLYAWFREQTDEPLAEYLMSCLAPAPLSDLATKADLAGIDKRFERVDQRFDMLFALREADRAEADALRERDRAEADALREHDRAEADALRERDRAEADALREHDRAEADALREHDRAEADALRERDRAERKSDLRSVKAHHYTVIGFIVALFVANLTIL